MTNQQIVLNAAQELAAEGKIKYTGNVLKFEDAEGKEVEFKETEDIHTYAHWLSLGYQVRKGQKAVAKIQIWKHSEKETETQDENPESAVNKGHMFLKVAAFFSASQVEAIVRKGGEQ